MIRFHRLAACALVLAVAPLTWAAGNKALAQAQAQYNAERAHCTSGKSHQDKATCLKEAGAAYQEARRGALAGNSGSSNLSQNATQRCDAQPAADREACIQRITGSGTTEGSVKGGGVIRQTETKVQ